MKYKWDCRKGKLYVAIRLSTLILILFIQLFNNSAYAYSDSDLQWIDAHSKRLEWGKSFTVNHGGNSYKIEAIDFITSDQLNAGGTPVVFVKLYKNNNLVLTTAVGVENQEIYNQEVKLTATDIIRTGTKWSTDVYNPWAVVEISFRGMPDLNIDVSTDKSEYDLATSQSYQTTYIVVSIDLKNIGGADVKNVNLNIDTAGLSIVNGQKQIYIGDLKKGETKSNILKLEMPKLQTDSQESYSYNIRANAQGEDIKGTKIVKTAEYVIKIKPKFLDTDLIISKYLSPSKINIQDRTFVELIIRNGGTYSLNNIVISDEIPNTFNLLDNIRLYWVIPNLKAGEEKKFNYTIKIKDNIVAQKEYTLSAAKMSYAFGGKSYSKSSNIPKISVEIPPVKLTKTLANNRVTPGSVIGITINAKNIGDRRVKINIKDDLPANAILVSGTNFDERFLNVGEEYNINYNIRLNENGAVNIPSSIGKMNDANGNQWDVQSNIPGDVLVAASTPIQTPIQSIITPIKSSTTNPTGNSNEWELSTIIGKTFDNIWYLLIAFFIYKALTYTRRSNSESNHESINTSGNKHYPHRETPFSDDTGGRKKKIFMKILRMTSISLSSF